MKVLEKPKAVKYIKFHQLETQYLKAKNYIKQGLFELVDLRKRQPKNQNLFYFRINKKLQVSVVTR